MDIAVFVICLLCCLGYGYSVPNDADNVTLVLSNTTCENNNSNDIPSKFETVSYAEFRDLYHQILALLNEGDSVQLADYGVIRHNSLKCLKLIETPENRKRVSEIKNSILLANEGPELSYENVLKSKSAFIGYLPSMCVYVPLMASDISCFKEVESSQCSKERSTDTTLQSSEIYLYMIASDFGQDITSVHMLCSYIIAVHSYDHTSNHIIAEIRYSHCDLPNDGAFCFSSTSKGNKDICDEGYYYDFSNYFFDHGINNACILQKRPGCWYQVCADEYITIEDYLRFLNEYELPFLFGRYVFYTDRERIILLDVYKTPNNNTKCISLTRERNRLLVNTTACDTPMNFICKKIPYNHTVTETTMNTILEIYNEGPRDYTLSIALISVGVSFVLILATVIVIVIKRRYIESDRDASSFSTQLTVSAVMGNVPDAGSVSGRGGTVDDDSDTGSVSGRGGTVDDDSDAGSVSGHGGTVDDDSDTGSVSGRGGTVDNDSNAGSVPGRGGTVHNDSYAGSVPGRGGTVDNDSYVRSVPGRAGTVDDDSFGGEVHGRTASGRINLY